MSVIRISTFLLLQGLFVSHILGVQLPNLQNDASFFENLQNLDGKGLDLKLEEWHQRTSGSLKSKNISEICQQHYNQLKEDIAQRKKYAIEFADSEGKLTSGILLGNLHWWGSYDQCTGAQKVDDDTKEVIFKGKYCRAIAINLLNIGRCFPDSCSAQDVLHILRPNNLSLVTDVVCPKVPDIETNDIVAIVLLSILGLFVVAGTITDLVVSRQLNSSITEKQTAGLFIRAVLSFSVISNLPKLLSTETRSGNIDVLNGIRVLSLFWVMVGHVFSFGLIVASDNLLAMREYFKKFDFQAVVNSPVAVDTFFLLSGLLVCYLTLRQLEKGKGKMNWFLFYFHRFWRLTPVYMFTVMMCATLVGNMLSDGPITDNINTVERYCTSTWWANLLYIQNFYSETNRHMCINWTWYLPNDMQFYFISPVIIIALFKKPKIGMVLIFLLLLMCLLVRGIVADVYELSPINFAKVTDPGLADRYYSWPYYRIAPYLTGLALGYYLWYKKLRIIISWPLAIIGWILAIALNMAVLYGTWGYYRDENYKMDVALVLYQTFNRWAWSLGVAWIVLACVAGKGGPINTFLSWRGWIPLARMSYTAYLIHVPIICLHSFSQHNPFHFDIYTLLYFFLAVVLMTFMASSVIVLAIELPMMGHEKIITGFFTWPKKKNMQDVSEVSIREAIIEKETKMQVHNGHASTSLGAIAFDNGTFGRTIDSEEPVILEKF